MNTTDREGAGGGWRMLGILAVAELLGMSLWFAGSAVASDLLLATGLPPGATGWVTTSVQLGFVAGTALAAVMNLADVVPARWYFATAALLGAAANATLTVVSAPTGLFAARFFTGFFLAGVYPRR